MLLRVNLLKQELENTVINIRLMRLPTWQWPNVGRRATKLQMKMSLEDTLSEP